MTYSLFLNSSHHPIYTMERLSIIKSHLSPHILKIPSSHTYSLQISRPKSRNAFNFEIIQSLTFHIRQSLLCHKPLLLTGIPGHYFGSGGDLKLVTSELLNIPEFLRSLHHMFYLTSLLPVSISLWTGHVIGSGAGLASSCKTRVAFPSTKYSMPENGIGLFPDVGASYFLTHYIQHKSLGLYISLTGCTLDGFDCFATGLCNYFVEEEHCNSIIEEAASEDPEKVVLRYHRDIRKGIS